MPFLKVDKFTLIELPKKPKKNTLQIWRGEGHCKSLKMVVYPPFSMSKIRQKVDTCANSLDTLAQVPPSSRVDLQKRARSKWYTTAVVSRLKYVFNTKLRKYYSHAWNCNTTIYQEGRKLRSRYCNTRVCNVCTRIRTAKLMNGYVDQLMQLEGIEFVTLTVKNCIEDDLKCCVDQILKQFTLINRNIREKKGIKVSGIRKIEVTYNSFTNTFHPHLHLLVDKNSGSLYVDEWLRRNPDSNIKAQDVRKADKGSLAEIFKYTTKMVLRKNGELHFYLKPLNAILECLYKRRCFQPFGIVKMVSEEVDELDCVEYDDLPDDFGVPILWEWNECDWVYEGDTLTGYIPPEMEIKFIE